MDLKEDSLSTLPSIMGPLAKTLPPLAVKGTYHKCFPKGEFKRFMSNYPVNVASLIKKLQSPEIVGIDIDIQEVAKIEDVTSLISTLKKALPKHFEFIFNPAPLDLIVENTYYNVIKSSLPDLNAKYRLKLWGPLTRDKLLKIYRAGYTREEILLDYDEHPPSIDVIDFDISQINLSKTVESTSEKCVIS